MTSPPCFDRPSACFKEKFIGIRWGGNALVSLYISVVSGIIVALQYNPAEPFYSTSTLELIIPFGSFWRALHYYSSQAFFLLLVVHLMAVIWENNHYYSRSTWVRLTLSIPLAMLLLFTGYILRYDATGEAAGLIAENLSLSIPALGHWLNKFFLSVSSEGVKRVYVHHLIGLMVIGGFCIWPHLRRYTTRWRDHLPLICLTLLLAVFLVTPIEPMQIGLLHIAGPWFFLGLQEALRYIHPFWAGIVFPGIVVGALLALPHKGPKRKRYVLLIWGWVAVYSLLTVQSYLQIF